MTAYNNIKIPCSGHFRCRDCDQEVDLFIPSPVQEQHRALRAKQKHESFVGRLREPSPVRCAECIRNLVQREIKAGTRPRIRVRQRKEGIRFDGRRIYHPRNA